MILNSLSTMIIVLIAFNGFGQHYSEINDLDSYIDSLMADSNNYEVRFIKDKYSNGNVKSLGKLYFFPSISITAKHGVFIEYYRNGQLKDSAYYHQGKRIGTTKHYYPSGIIKELAEWNQHNVVPGRDSKRFQNIKNSDKNLTTKVYNRKGNLILEGTLRNGEKQGLWKFYNNGKIYKEVFYVNGKKKKK